MVTGAVVGPVVGRGVVGCGVVGCGPRPETVVPTGVVTTTPGGGGVAPGTVAVVVAGLLGAIVTVVPLGV